VCEQFNQQGSLLWRLVLNFKVAATSFEEHCTNKINHSEEQFKERYRNFSMRFVQFMIKVLNSSYLLEKAAKNEGEATFITDQNLHTLVTSLLFEDEDFRRITTQVYEVSLVSHT